MTIDDLRNFRKMAFTIRYWRRELEEMQRNSYTRSPQLTGMPGGGGLSNPTSDRAMREGNIMERIERLEAEQSKEAERIMDWIQDIEDPVVQVIMHARYIRNKSWAAVAAALGGGNTPQNVRQIHHRYLSHLSHKTG